MPKPIKEYVKEVKRVEATLDPSKGNVALRQQDLALALASYRKALDITRRVARLASDSEGAQHELAIALLKLGQVPKQMGNRRVSRQELEASLEVFRGLATTDPRNARAQREYAVALLREGVSRGLDGTLLKTNADLKPLRKRQDFQKLLNERAAQP